MSTLAIAPYGRRFFAYGLGGWGDQSAQNAAADKPGFTVDSWGGGFGTDWNLFNHGIVGYGLHGGSTNVKPRSGGVYKTSLSTFAGYLHFSVFDALWRIDASLGWARNWQRQRLLSDRSYNIFTTSQWLFVSARRTSASVFDMIFRVVSSQSIFSNSSENIFLFPLVVKEGG